MMGCTIFYYLGIIIELMGWLKPQWGIFYVVHDLHRLLFFIPVLYAAYIFRVKGAIVTAVISMLVFLYRAMIISPYAESLLRPIVFVIILGGVGILVSKLLDNVTERGQAEEALWKSKERFRALTESTSDWVWEVDADGVYTYASPKVRDLLGYEPEEVIGKTPFDLMPPEEAKRVAEEFRITMESQRPFARLENTNLHKDSRLVVLETSGVPIFSADGQLCGYRGIDRDITERKQAEEALKSSRDYLKKLTDSMWDAVFSVKMPERVIEWANDSFKLTGYEPEESIGKTTQFLYPDESGFFTFGDKLKSAIAEGKDVLDTEQLLKRKNGEVFPAEITTTFFREKGEVIRVTSIIRDITERKKLEQLKDDFISLVSHELRSPLTVITGAVNTALTEGERLSAEETRQLLKDAALEAESLSHLLGNLLELSRMQANRLLLYAEAISVKKVIQGTVKEIKRQSSAHQFVVDLPRKLPPVYADELRLERILYNLLENAVKYSPQGGEIRVSVRPEEEHLVIGVRDQGIGISLADQAKLFGPFQRLEDSRLDGVGGAGLGLLVCRRLVEAHGGRIWLESEPGRGSTA